MIGGVLFAILMVLAGGIGLAMLVLPKRDCFVQELGALAVVLGSSATTGIWFVLSFGLAGAALRWSVAFACAGLFIVGLWRFRRSGIRMRCGDIGWTIALIWLVQFLVVTWQTLGQPITSDGIYTWELKAKLAFMNGGRVPPFCSHPHYPLNVSLLGTWVYSWIGEAHQGAYKLMWPLFFAAGIGLLWTTVKRLTGCSRQAGIASVLLFFVPWLMFKPGGVASGWADFPLAVSYLSALGYLLEIAGEGGVNKIRELAALLACCLATLPWTKQEGGLLAVVLIAGLALILFAGPCRKGLHGNLKGLLPALCMIVAVPALVIVGWRIFLAVKHAGPERDFLPVSLANFFENAHRIPTIMVMFAKDLVSWDRWNILWPLAILALAVVNRRRPMQAAVLTLAIVAPACLYVVVYVFSASGDNFVLHINSSVTRLLIPLSMPALMLVGIASGKNDAQTTKGAE